MLDESEIIVLLGGALDTCLPYDEWKNSNTSKISGSVNSKLKFIRVISTAFKGTQMSKTARV